jgi:hypothetical protein
VSGLKKPTLVSQILPLKGEGRVGAIHLGVYLWRAVLR